jgi:hypothetical protein
MKEQNHERSICEAIHATYTTPSFFPSFKTERQDLTLGDFNVQLSNPISEAIDEASEHHLPRNTERSPSTITPPSIHKARKPSQGKRRPKRNLSRDIILQQRPQINAPDIFLYPLIRYHMHASRLEHLRIQLHIHVAIQQRPTFAPTISNPISRASGFENTQTPIPHTSPSRLADDICFMASGLRFPSWEKSGTPLRLPVLSAAGAAGTLLNG